jgi:uncharacterized iron-regulated protein
MKKPTCRSLRHVGAALLFFAAGAACAQSCVALGAWLRPGDRESVTGAAVYEKASHAEVVLLGESHAQAPHHRWQLETLQALRALHPAMVIGFEMFPRRVQPVLDRWVAGELTADEFLRQSDWKKVWRFDFELYRPLFEFARTHGIPMRALNVEQALVRDTGANGFDAVARDRREGVSSPAPPAGAYVERLGEVYAQHRHGNGVPALDDPKFQRFVDAQLLWDRAMAQGLADALRDRPDALAVGIMGRGHVEYGQGVAHQLRDLGVSHIVTLLPWDADESCETLSADIADAVYGVEASPADK